MSGNFLGLKYPITKSQAGYFGTISDANTIKSDLLILLLTNFGERVMLNSFGANLRQLVFEQNNPALETVATSLINTAIAKWEPRVSITSLVVTSSVSNQQQNPNTYNSDTQDHVLTITIQFAQFTSITTIDTLVLNFQSADNND